MNGYLRQSTASQEIKLGPFLDDSDGKTPETALSIANTDIKLTKHGTTAEASKNSGGGTHIASGRYGAILDATDTDTAGNLEIDCAMSGALPVKAKFVILPQGVYDWLFAGGTLIEDQVWDADRTDHPTVGTFGEVVETDDLVAAMFTTDSGETYASAVAGSVVKEIADNASGGGGGTDAMLLQSTTIATLSSQTSFTLTAGSSDNNAYVNAMAVVTDQSTATQKCIGRVSGYVGSTKTVTLAVDPGVFTMAVGDSIKLYAMPEQISIPSDIGNRIADHVIKRPTASVEASSVGDGGTSPSHRSLYGALALSRHKRVRSGSNLTIYKSDDTTTLTTDVLSTNASAEPVVSVDPAA